MLGEIMRKSPPLFIRNFSVENVKDVLIAVKEGKHDRDLAESTAEKDGVVSHYHREAETWFSLEHNAVKLLEVLLVIKMVD